MGVEYALVCKKCKTYIDLHKCGMTNMLCDRHAPYHPHSTDKIEHYWGMRAFWYTWKHREHGGELEWRTDCSDDYWEMMGRFEEEASHDKMWQEKPESHYV